MTNPQATFQSLLRLSAKDRGASSSEAVTAAKAALDIARKHGLGGLAVARARNVVFKAERRLDRVRLNGLSEVSSAL